MRVGLLINIYSQLHQELLSCFSDINDEGKVIEIATVLMSGII